MCVRRFVLIGMILIAWLSSDTTTRAGQLQHTTDTTRDIQQTILARQILLEDPHLANQNIGVIVKNRIAILWGPVPSAETAFRAELCLRTMIELVEVRNELFVHEQQEFLPSPLKAPLKIDTQPQFLPDRIPPKLPVLPLLPQGPRSMFGAPGMLMHQEPVASRQKPAVEIQVLPSNRMALPMLGVPQPAREGDPRAQAMAGNPAEQEMTAAVRAVLQGKSSYRPLQFAVKEGRVYLRAANEDADALHEAARAISRLPQVEGVILLEKASPR